MNTQTDLSVIIVNYNTPQLTKECIESVKKFTKNIGYEIILVENSLDKQILRYNDIKILRNKQNVGFAKANNQGIKISRGRYVLLLNSDTVIHDNVLGEMVGWMDKNEKIGVSTCALKNKDESLQGTGGYFPTLLSVFSWMTIQDVPYVDRLIKPFHPMREKTGARNNSFYKKERELDWITGAFMFIRREVIDKVGGLDEDYFMYTEDTDFCYRAKKLGWKVIYNPKWSITHLGGASSTREFPILTEFKSIKLFYRKHYAKWQYVPLRLILKIGALGRMILFGLIEGADSAKIYAKAFWQA